MLDYIHLNHNSMYLQAVFPLIQSSSLLVLFVFVYIEIPREIGVSDERDKSKCYHTNL